jgi:hypothetical protein
MYVGCCSSANSASEFELKQCGLVNPAAHHSEDGDGDQGREKSRGRRRGSGCQGRTSDSPRLYGVIHGFVEGLSGAVV